MSTHFDSARSGEDEREIDTACGYPAGSFACKIRHLQINTGDAKAAADLNDPAALPSRTARGIERL